MQLKKRVRFAWWPVPVFAIPRPFMEVPIRYVWLGYVTEVLTLWGTWVAYENDNEVPA